MSEEVLSQAHPAVMHADSAREAVLDQHRQIRATLRAARMIADAALAGDRFPARDVAVAIRDLRIIMEAHLAFEERVLLPILDDDLPVGPLRAEHLLAEHRDQRHTLAQLDAEALAHPELPTLAAKLAAFAGTLIDDMDEEERSLLTRDAVRDDVIVVGQDCG